MKNVLITGASGFLGWKTALYLSGRFQAYGTYHEHSIAIEGCPMLPLDLADEGGTRRLLDDLKPEIIVHTAALSDPDACERDRSLAFRVNAQGTETLARYAARNRSRLIYTSTDLVYDGTRGNYDESDEPNPLNSYAQTKLLGEQKVMRHCEDGVILRLALLYGWGHGLNRSFTDWMMENLAHGKEIRLLTDQYRTPLLVDQAAEVIARVIEDPSVRGVFTVGGGERVNRCEFGLKFCEVFGLPTELIKPVEMKELGYLAPRPKDCSLNSSKIVTLLGIQFFSVTEGMRKMRANRLLGSLHPPPSHESPQRPDRTGQPSRRDGKWHG